jgi:hypothetical protein
MVVNFLEEFILSNVNKERVLLNFVQGVLKLHTGRFKFLRAARIELKGRIGNKPRKSKSVISVGTKDSFNSALNWKRSYEKSIVTKKGVVHLRVVFFYFSFTQERKETIKNLGLLKARREEMQKLPESVASKELDRS